MGYCHSWTLSQDLTPSQWARLLQGGQLLARDMPAQVQRGQFVEGHRLTWSDRVSNALWKRFNTPPFSVPQGAVGLLNAQENAIAIGPGNPNLAADVFLFPRTMHDGFCQTNAHFYDRLVVGVLLLAQELTPQSFRFTASDMEDVHRDALIQWVRHTCASVLATRDCVSTTGSSPVVDPAPMADSPAAPSSVSNFRRGPRL